MGDIQCLFFKVRTKYSVEIYWIIGVILSILWIPTGKSIKVLYLMIAILSRGTLTLARSSGMLLNLYLLLTYNIGQPMCAMNLFGVINVGK